MVESIGMASFLHSVSNKVFRNNSHWCTLLRRKWSGGADEQDSYRKNKRYVEDC